jgi:hypothetical protein
MRPDQARDYQHALDTLDTAIAAGTQQGRRQALAHGHAEATHPAVRGLLAATAAINEQEQR